MFIKNKFAFLSRLISNSDLLKFLIFIDIFGLFIFIIGIIYILLLPQLSIYIYLFGFIFFIPSIFFLILYYQLKKEKEQLNYPGKKRLIKFIFKNALEEIYNILNNPKYETNSEKNQKIFQEMKILGINSYSYELDNETDKLVFIEYNQNRYDSIDKIQSYEIQEFFRKLIS